MNELVQQEQQPATQLQAIDSTPARLLEMAVSKDLDIEKLEKLMAMQKEWEAGQAKKAFYDAMAKFQNECPTILKRQTADFGAGRAKYKYADLGEIAETIKPLLAKHGFSYRWSQIDEKNVITITCVVTHLLGHEVTNSITSALLDPGNNRSINSIQLIGVTVQYLRRYTLTSALGLATADYDSDGKLPDPVVTITEQQYSQLIDLLNASNGNEAAFCKIVAVNDLRQLAADKFNQAKAVLDKRLEKFKNAATN